MASAMTQVAVKGGASLVSGMGGMSGMKGMASGMGRMFNSSLKDQSGNG